MRACTREGWTLIAWSELCAAVESENTGSMKDRMALGMFEGAAADGRLKAKGSVIEYTTGSTGTPRPYASWSSWVPARPSSPCCAIPA
jgi:hypothetical protein